MAAENGSEAGGRKSATMAEIARECGVSRATVSRALNNDPKVKPATRELVLRVAKRLNYHPNLAAVGLKGGRSYFIGIVVDYLTEETSRMIAAVEKGCREQKYHVALCIAGNDREVAADWIKRNTYLEGAVFLRSKVHKVVWERIEHIPSVYAYYLVDNGADNCIIPDNTQGAVEAVNHLLSLGHRRIAFINGPAEWEAHVTRRNGWKLALQAAGVSPAPNWEEEADGTIDSGFKAARRLLSKMDKPPTAIFACSDRIAVGVLQAVRALGLSVPQDLSVVGFEDKEFAQCTSPALTTVRLPLEEVAELALHRLLDKVHRGSDKKWPLLKVNCQLVKRESTAAPPQAPKSERIVYTGDTAMPSLDKCPSSQ
jgi:DNA-binding LacI/PurR family transcriptional regulator